MQRSFILSTCGTSLLTFQAKPSVRTILNRTANKKALELTPEEKQVIDEIVALRKKELKDGDVRSGRKMSAEINGLMGFYEGDPNTGTGNTHYFLRSDTYQGEMAASLLLGWMKHNDLHSQEISFSGLSTRDLPNFNSAMSDLVKWCHETLPGYRKSSYQIVFNLVGGFKSLQGLVQNLGMFYADKSIYIFEGSESLLVLPRLPVNLEQGFADTIKNNLSLVRRLSLMDIPSVQCKAIPSVMLFSIDEKSTLSTWGELLLSQFKEKEYSREAFDPPVEQIEIAQDAKKTLANATPGQIHNFNERMDDLARYLATGENINRLDFKKLRGDPMPPCTHEMDISSGEWRAFGRYTDQGHFTILSVGKTPLH